MNDLPRSLGVDIELTEQATKFLAEILASCPFEAFHANDATSYPHLPEDSYTVEALARLQEIVAKTIANLSETVTHADTTTRPQWIKLLFYFQSLQTDIHRELCKQTLVMARAVQRDLPSEVLSFMMATWTQVRAEA